MVVIIEGAEFGMLFWCLWVEATEEAAKNPTTFRAAPTIKNHQTSKSIMWRLGRPVLDTPGGLIGLVAVAFKKLYSATRNKTDMVH